LIIRWPGKVAAGATCDDLVDFTDLMPTLCELTGAALPDEAIHGRSFAPQLLGHASTPRDWVHIQDYEKRYVRSRDYIYTNEGQLRPVVKIWQEPAPPIKQPSAAIEQAAIEQLDAALSQLGDDVR
jgi:arylsulfatase A-like enzyme